jgi:hypothetical protein
MAYDGTVRSKEKRHNYYIISRKLGNSLYGDTVDVVNLSFLVLYFSQGLDTFLNFEKTITLMQRKFDAPFVPMQPKKVFNAGWIKEAKKTFIGEFVMNKLSDTLLDRGVGFDYIIDRYKSIAECQDNRAAIVAVGKLEDLVREGLEEQRRSLMDKEEDPKEVQKQLPESKNESTMFLEGTYNEDEVVQFSNGLIDMIPGDKDKSNEQTN